MDRQEFLRSLTDEELLNELQRRIEESQARMKTLMAGMNPPPGKFFKKSLAKVKYWGEWREYKAAHPDATMEQWRRSRRRAKK